MTLAFAASAASTVTAMAAKTATTTTTAVGNLVANPGFETSTVDWRTNGSDELLTRVKRPHTGLYSGELTTTTTTTAVLNDNPNTVSSTQAGALYTASVWVRALSPSASGELRLREVASGTQVGKGSTPFTLSDTSWHQLKLTYTAVGSGDALDLNVAVNNLAPKHAVDIDDVSLTMTAATAPSPSPTSSPSTSPSPSTSASPSSCTVNAILVPSCGLWTGVAPNPLNGESWDQALLNFEAQTGRTAQIAHYYHRGPGLFPTAQEITRATETGKNRLLLENWKPENGSTWAQVAAGAQDAEIDAEAAYIKSHFTRRFFLALHGEPERTVNQTAGSGYTAANYAAMYRHVILRLRADGVTNIVSVLDLTGAPNWGAQSWFSSLYPGNDVVDWLAEDPYDIGPKGGAYDTNYGGLVNRTMSGYNWPGFVTWAGKVAPGKPIMLAEWGVDELSTDPTWKPGKFTDAAANLANWPQVKALVYWNSNNFNPVGTTRIDSSSASLAAYLKLLSSPLLQQHVPTS